ncbi:MAG: dTDP-4-dehydrorhamnose reductase [Alistipes sp.]|nr:dTDP-4-dehydrorhamnose reductase [Alistipes sp.]
MNILVTGADGQLGRELRLATRTSKDDYHFTDVAELDITDAAAIRALVRSRQIEAIVNCAAYTNVERAEEEPEAAERLNAVAVRHLAEAMREVGGLLVHISTDYVFGGDLRNTPCTEELPTNPTGVYGRTKLRGEQAVVETGCRHLIIRTSWLYSEYGKNFVKTMLDLTATRPELKVVFDQAGTPTYAGDLAQAIFEILEARKYEGNTGIYHYSNEGVCSWYDFAKAIAEAAGHTACDIRPCRTSEYPSKAARPAYSVLDKSRFKEAFGIRIPYWSDSLKACIRNLTEQND